MNNSQMTEKYFKPFCVCVVGVTILVKVLWGMNFLGPQGATSSLRDIVTQVRVCVTDTGERPHEPSGHLLSITVFF